MSDSLIGKQLGDYQIRDLLGRGGMARVYTGYDARLDRLAAVKVINSDFNPADQAEYFERFQREARAIARLNHPNIVGVYQFGQHEESYYMAMVFVEGHDLRQILREYSDQRVLIPVRDVLNVVRGIGSALDYAHSRGVIHRDIKPSNIMLTRDSKRAILTDFGLALSTSEGTLGETFGSAHYIAPEQAISSAKAVPQSDLYSLGICLYEMLTGQVPFDDPSAMTVALKHLQDPPPRPRSINPELSAAVEHVLLRAIDKDPARRYPSGVELTRALEGALESQTLSETSELSISEIQAAIRPIAPVTGQEKHETTRPPDTSAAPVPAIPVVEKKSANPTAQGSGKSAGGLTAVAELPPPPAEAVSTEIGGSAINPSLSAVLPRSKTLANSDGTDREANRPVWLFPLLAALIVLIILILLGGYVVSQKARLFGIPALVDLTRSVTAPNANNNGLTQTALLVAIIPTAAATVPATQAATVAATVGSSDTTSIVPGGSSTDAPTSPTSSAALLTPSANPSTAQTADATVNWTATIPANASISAATSSLSTEGNNVLLLYNGAELDVVNQTNRSLSLAGVTFSQVGTSRTFTADEWLKIASMLKPGECYQLFAPNSVITQPSLNPHLTSPCGLYQIKAYYGRRYADNYYFWAAIPQTPTALATVLPTSFNVLYGGQVIANCLFSDGRCSFSLTKSAN